MSRVPSAASFFQKKSVLITGASAGIGEELALQLAHAGAKLTLAARRTDRLETLAQRIAGQGTEVTGETRRNTRPIVVECDVTRDGDLERAVAESVRAFGKLDIAFANAGFGVVAPLKKLSLDDYRRQFETNVFGVLRTIYAALPELEKTKGNLAIIGSVSGWISTPGASPYSMSKFALRALADAITPELRSTGVKVTLISPGFVASEIRKIDNQGIRHEHAKDPIPPRMVVPTPKAVREILRAVARGKREQIVTGHGKIFVAIQRYAPWLLRAATSRVAAIRTKEGLTGRPPSVLADEPGRSHDTRKWE